MDKKNKELGRFEQAVKAANMGGMTPTAEC
jgi:hypothetical protein